MSNSKFGKKTTIKYCKLIYGFDQVNMFGDTNSFSKYNLPVLVTTRERWEWKVNLHLKIGFNKTELKRVNRDLKIKSILNGER